MTPTVEIAGHKIGPGRSCFVIAEAGVNHNGDMDLARRLIDVAATSGADAVKFQTFTADRLADRNAPKAAYQMNTTSATESQHAMLKRLELAPDDHRTLIEHCARRGIMFLSSPFDEVATDLLDALRIPAFKIPSGEIVNLPFLSHVAAKRRPIILSSGMATMEEVAAAMEAIRAAGNDAIVLLHCVSNYPAPADEANLRSMATMASAFGAPVGFSDHTAGIAVALGAVALGACVIEKHFTMDRSLPGPDHRASLEPSELADMIRGIRTIEAALGDGQKRPQACEMENRVIVRKSLVAAHNLPAGTVLQATDLAATRPGTGLSPAKAPLVVGRSVRVAVAAGAQISLDQLT